jgi:hypothetical protein
MTLLLLLLLLLAVCMSASLRAETLKNRKERLEK